MNFKQRINKYVYKADLVKPVDNSLYIYIYIYIYMCVCVLGKNYPTHKHTHIYSFI